MKSITPYFYLTLLCLALYLPGIFTLPIVDNDEPLFAQASRQLVETDNYLQINFQNKPRHLKPPGIYWLQATSVKAFSNAQSTNPWSYRLPSILGGWLAVLLTFAFARRFYDRKTAFLAAAFLGSSFLLIIESHLAITDALLLSTMVLMQGGLWQTYVIGRENKKINLIWPSLFWIGMAAGLFIKGITPLIGFLTLSSLSIADRNLSLFKQVRIFWGILFVILISLVWLVPISIASHSNFLFDMIRGDVIPKLIGGTAPHKKFLGYYLVIFNIMFWPGALYIWHANMWGWNNRNSPKERFLIAWILSTWIFYFFVPTKLPEYLLPTYPAIAIFISVAVTNWQENKWHYIPKFICKAQYFAWAAYGIFMAAFLFYFPIYLSKHISMIGMISALMIIIVIMFALINTYKKNYRRAAAITIIGSVLVMAPVFQWLLPNLNALWLTENLVAAIHKDAPGKMSSKFPLLSIDYNEPSMVFMTNTNDVMFSSIQSSVIRLKNHKSKLVVVNNKLSENFLNYANESHLQLKLLDTISGYDYSHGYWVSLNLYENV